jgi:hypothetical protein
MSWLFSRALVEEYSAASCSGGEPCVQLSVMPSPHPFWRKDKTMDFSGPSQFGLTCRVLTADLGAALLTWFLAGFPVRTFPSPDVAMDSTANAAGCGRKWRGSLARFDPASHSWRTAQLSLLGDSDEFSETWPRWGTTVAGELYLLPVLVPPTSENESGFWPTPNVPNGGRSVAHVTDWRGKSAYSDKGVKVQVGLEAAVKRSFYTTPCVSDTSHRKQKYAQGGTPLSMQAGGALNPPWVEWLMGWPIGWTAMQPLAMDRFQAWPHSHSEPCMTTEEVA